jgi:hypothetical protein
MRNAAAFALITGLMSISTPVTAKRIATRCRKNPGHLRAGDRGDAERVEDSGAQNQQEPLSPAGVKEVLISYREISKRSNIASAFFLPRSPERPERFVTGVGQATPAKTMRNRGRTEQVMGPVISLLRLKFVRTLAIQFDPVELHQNSNNGRL